MSTQLRSGSMEFAKKVSLSFFLEDSKNANNTSFCIFLYVVFLYFLAVDSGGSPAEHCQF